MGLDTFRVHGIVAEVVLENGVLREEDTGVGGSLGPAPVRFLGLAGGAIGAGGRPPEPSSVGELDDLGDASVQLQFDGIGFTARVGIAGDRARPAQARCLPSDAPGRAELGITSTEGAGATRGSVGELLDCGVDLAEGVQVRQLPVWCERDRGRKTPVIPRAPAGPSHSATDLGTERHPPLRAAGAARL